MSVFMYFSLSIVFSVVLFWLALDFFRRYINKKFKAHDYLITVQESEIKWLKSNNELNEKRITTLTNSVFKKVMLNKNQ